jgi:hypothetical protein
MKSNYSKYRTALRNLRLLRSVNRHRAAKRWRQIFQQMPFLARVGWYFWFVPTALLIIAILWELTGSMGLLPSPSWDQMAVLMSVFVLTLAVAIPGRIYAFRQREKALIWYYDTYIKENPNLWIYE